MLDEAIEDVRMGRHLGDRKRVGLLTPSLAEGVAAPDMDRRPPTEIGQGEVYPPIAAEGGAEKREERLVLVDGQ